MLPAPFNDTLRGPSTATRVPAEFCWYCARFLPLHSSCDRSRWTHRVTALERGTYRVSTRMRRADPLAHGDGCRRRRAVTSVDLLWWTRCGRDPEAAGASYTIR